MNLDQHLHLRYLLIDRHPDTVDVAANRRLRNPRQRCRKCLLQPIKDVPAITKPILHKAVGLNLVQCAVVPTLDSRSCCKPAFLRLIDFVHASTRMGGNGACATSVIGSVAEDLCELPFQFPRSFVLLVARMGFHQLFQWRWLLSIQQIDVEQVDVRAHTQSLHQLLILRFPHYHLQIRSVQVHIEESHAGIGNVHAAHVRKSKGHPPRLRLADGLTLFRWDVLQISTSLKSILRRG